MSSPRVAIWQTANVDPEIATIAGPQLVCPVDSARFALNAANARWGSLLDALYGTDAVPGPRGGGYRAERGRLAFDAAEDFLDEAFPLERAASQPKASPKGQQAWLPWSDVRELRLEKAGGGQQLVSTAPGEVEALQPKALAALRGMMMAPPGSAGAPK